MGSYAHYVDNYVHIPPFSCFYDLKTWFLLFFALCYQHYPQLYQQTLLNHNFLC